LYRISNYDVLENFILIWCWYSHGMW